MLSHTWAQVIVAVTDNATDALPADAMHILHNHVHNCAGPEILRDLIQECYVSRAWAGDSSNLKIAKHPLK
jgi:hypothetical protein